MAKISASGRRQKGARFERKVRDELKKIYPTERRSAINRVPMSGGGWMKGDLVDMNNTDWSYEAKCQETLQLPTWWRQTKAQTKSYQTACLVFSSNHRPMYWVLHLDDYKAYEADTVFDGTVEHIPINTMRIYDKLGKLEANQVATTSLDGDAVAILPNDYFLELRRGLLR